MYALRAARDDDAPRLAELLSIGQTELVTAIGDRRNRRSGSPRAWWRPIATGVS